MAPLAVNKQCGGKAKKRLSQRRAARILGVHWVHLNRVLKGHRSSPRLVNVYNELIARYEQRGDAGPAETVAQMPEGARIEQGKDRT
jgi:hypothetical protein